MEKVNKTLLLGPSGQIGSNLKKKIKLISRKVKILYKKVKSRKFEFYKKSSKQNSTKFNN